MATKGQTSRKTINIGDLNNITHSNINIAGGSIHQTTINRGSVDDEIKALFSQIYQAIEKRAGNKTNRRKLETEIKEIENVSISSKKPDKNFITQRLLNIQRMAPDILDVIIASIGSPAAGTLLVLKNIAKKVKAGNQ